MDNMSLPCNINLTTPKELYNEILSIDSNKNILFVCGESVRKYCKLDGLFNSCNDRFNSVSYVKTVANPTDKTILDAILSINVQPDIIIAIGGGSAIDIAKSVSCLFYLKDKELNINTLLSSINNREYINETKGIDIVAVPTTSGTGSEVTPFATIWDSNGLVKYSVDSDFLYPHVSYIVPEYTITMPIEITLSTALDALSHCVESYWAKASNQLTKELSKTAIRIIVKYLPMVIKNPENLMYRTKMCIGSLYAGLALSQAKATACHSISYPLTMRFNMLHGFACAITLTEILKINLPSMVDGDDLLEAFGVSDIKGVCEFIDNVTSGITNLRLSHFGIEKSDIEFIANSSFTAGRMDNNPVALEKKDVEILLNRLL